MFAFVIIRVLAIVGFTLLPMTIFNLWYQEELESWEKKNLGWFRAAGNVIIGSIALSIMLALVA